MDQSVRRTIRVAPLLILGFCLLAAHPQAEVSGSRDAVSTEHTTEARELLRRVAEVFPEGRGEEASPVAAFPFTLTLTASDDWAHQQGIPVKGMQLALRGWSLRSVAHWDPFTVVALDQRAGPGWIDLCAVKATAVSPDLPFRPRNPPEIGFYAEPLPFWVPPDRVVLLRVRFEGDEELFCLRHDPRARQLRLEALRVRHGRSAPDAAVPFAALEVREGQRRYQVNPLLVSARRGEQVLWNGRCQCRGVPELFQAGGPLLFGATDAGHSFYLSKSDGNVIFYSTARLAGEDPVAEVIALGRKAMARGPFEDRSLFRYIEALARLGDKRAAPFLIDAIPKGQGLYEKAKAVAALEKLNGNEEPWGLFAPDAPDSARDWHDRMAMRLSKDEAQEQEQAKWRKIFGVKVK